MQRRRFLQSVTVGGVAGITGFSAQSPLALGWEGVTVPFDGPWANPLMAPPQWILCADGNIVLWLWAVRGVRSVKLRGASAADASVLRRIGFPVDTSVPVDADGFAVLTLAAGGAWDLAGSTFSLKVAATEGTKETAAWPMAVPARPWTGGAFRFLAASCLNPGKGGRVRTLEAMAATAADAVFLLGDSTYSGGS
jgi:hypothetical protein